MERVGDSIKTENANWSFKGDVAKNFDGHVSKSVPFYNEGHQIVGKLSDFFLNSGSLCYELGCSTGKLTSLLVERNKNKSVNFIGIDSVPEMIEEASSRLSSFPNVSLETADLCDFEFKKSDLVISYYTMQFIKPARRQEIFNKIYESLNWGGAFILFEKVRGPDARFQDILTQLYSDYKLEQGYSSEEIISKTRSLKGVLEPFSTQGNIDLLKRAGFSDIMTVQKYLCFEGFLAIK